MIIKVMICLPMSGRTEEAIKTRIDEIKNTYGPYFTKKYGNVEWLVNMKSDDKDIEDIHKDASLYFLGRGIMECMSEADIVLFDSKYELSHGCCVEMDICTKYSKPFMIVNEKHLAEQMKIVSLGLTLPGLYRLDVATWNRHVLTKEDERIIDIMVNCDYMVVIEDPTIFEVLVFTKGKVTKIQISSDLFNKLIKAGYVFKRYG